jgi:alpha-D-xyloside xylohydrolase
MRALAMDWPVDERVANVTDEFMYGPALLIAPVVQAGARQRSVYLPANEVWYDFWTGESVSRRAGNKVDARAPLSHIPIFVRGGSIVPLGPVLQYAAEKAEDPIELRIYAGADGTFELYDDAGDGYAYERGERATIPIEWRDKERALTIGGRSGAFPGMVARRTFRIVLVRPGHGTGGGTTNRPDAVLDYDGRPRTVKIP